MATAKKVDFTAATARARHIRARYKELEIRLHGSAWIPQEIMLGYLHDIGELGRLVMAAEERWLHDGDLPRELEDKLSECLWWVLILADRRLLRWQGAVRTSLTAPALLLSLCRFFTGHALTRSRTGSAHVRTLFHHLVVSCYLQTVVRALATHLSTQPAHSFVERRSTNEVMRGGFTKFRTVLQ